MHGRRHNLRPLACLLFHLTLVALEQVVGPQVLKLQPTVEQILCRRDYSRLLDLLLRGHWQDNVSERLRSRLHETAHGTHGFLAQLACKDLTDQCLLVAPELVEDKTDSLRHVLLLPTPVVGRECLENVVNLNMRLLREEHLPELALEELHHLLPELVVLLIHLRCPLLQFQLEGEDPPDKVVRHEQGLYEAVHVARVVGVPESHPWRTKVDRDTIRWRLHVWPAGRVHIGPTAIVLHRHRVALHWRRSVIHTKVGHLVGGSAHVHGVALGLHATLTAEDAAHAGASHHVHAHRSVNATSNLQALMQFH
mmetsp:Transcript_36430/g.96902  ORF Transcript_36430/g.96902 Transcript_36430/m.96902 type:complete len:309 (+) Transcript_36430:541-1467(+)